MIERPWAEAATLRQVDNRDKREYTLQLILERDTLRAEVQRLRQAMKETDSPREGPMRMTDEQIKQTVALMRVSEAEKSIILKRALANDPATRLLVYSRFIKK